MKLLFKVLRGFEMISGLCMHRARIFQNPVLDGEDNLNRIDTV